MGVRRKMLGERVGHAADTARSLKDLDYLGMLLSASAEHGVSVVWSGWKLRGKIDNCAVPHFRRS